MCSIEGWGIVGPISGDGYNFAQLLEQAYEALLVHGTCACHNLKTGKSSPGFVVCEGLKFCPRDDLIVGRAFSPETDLSGDLFSRTRGIPRDDLHADTSLSALLDSRGHFATHGIHDAEDAL